MPEDEARQWRGVDVDVEAVPALDRVVIVALTVPPLQRCVCFFLLVFLPLVPPPSIVPLWTCFFLLVYFPFSCMLLFGLFLFPSVVSSCLMGRPLMLPATQLKSCVHQQK